MKTLRVSYINEKDDCVYSVSPNGFFYDESFEGIDFKDLLLKIEKEKVVSIVPNVYGNTVELLVSGDSSNEPIDIFGTLTYIKMCIETAIDEHELELLNNATV